MGVYRGIAQDNVNIISGTATLQSLEVLGTRGVVGNISPPVTSIAATGSTSADAAALLNYGVVHVTGANGTNGVRLPMAVGSRIVILKNADAANAILRVYPHADDRVNNGVVTTGALSMAARTSAIFVAFDDVNWFTVPLLPS